MFIEFWRPLVLSILTGAACLFGAHSAGSGARRSRADLYMRFRDESSRCGTGTRLESLVLGQEQWSGEEFRIVCDSAYG